MQRLSGASRFASLAATTPAETQTFTYDPTGNLVGKGSQYTGYNYTAATGCTNAHVQPHAVRQVTAGGALRSYCYDANGNLTTITGTNAGYTTVSWWASNLARKMAKGATSAEFWYGPDRARVLQVATRATESERTVYLGSLYERTVITPTTGSVTTRHVHYVRAGDETLAIKTWSKVGTGAYSPSVRYLHRDHLGSVVAISTETGTVESRSSFDAWGKRRDPNTWVTPAAGTFTAAPTATDRGYTGHENIDELGLVHMNGRIYDPEIGKFLSADPTMQFPESTQGYNRYAYTGNNPLTYTDPSGFSFWKSVMKAMGWIGFIIGLVFPVTMLWWQTMLQNAWQGFLMSGGNLKAGLLAGLTAGLGMGLNKLSFVAKAGLLGKLAVSGLISSAMGGSFGKGALGGLVGMVKNAAISQLLETSGIAESIRTSLAAGTSDERTTDTKSSNAAGKDKIGPPAPESVREQARDEAQERLNAVQTRAYDSLNDAATAAKDAMVPTVYKFKLELGVNFFSRTVNGRTQYFVCTLAIGNNFCSDTTICSISLGAQSLNDRPYIGSWAGDLHIHPDSLGRVRFSPRDLSSIRDLHGASRWGPHTSFVANRYSMISLDSSVFNSGLRPREDWAALNAAARLVK